MSKSRVVRLARLTRRATIMVAALVVPLAFAATASAKEPTKGFAVFKQCPRFTTGVFICMYTETLSGEVTLGKQTVPINKDGKHPIILQGGIIVNPETGAESFVGALNGETLSKTPQLVPGGLIGTELCKALPFFLKGLCEEFLTHGLTEVKATTELAKSAENIGISTRNLETKEGTVLSLPLKVKLENLFLGNNCYIGSSSHPITVNLTAGTTSPPEPNKPIEGKAGLLEFTEEFEIAILHENTLVDNAFSVPEATGCGGIFSFLIDPVIDAKLGLPSAAGHNTAIENNTIQESGVESVIASEK